MKIWVRCEYGNTTNFYIIDRTRAKAVTEDEKVISLVIFLNILYHGEDSLH